MISAMVVRMCWASAPVVVSAQGQPGLGGGGFVDCVAMCAHPGDPLHTCAHKRACKYLVGGGGSAVLKGQHSKHISTLGGRPFCEAARCSAIRPGPVGQEGSGGCVSRLRLRMAQRGALRFPVPMGATAACRMFVFQACLWTAAALSRPTLRKVPVSHETHP